VVEVHTNDTAFRRLTSEAAELARAQRAEWWTRAVDGTLKGQRTFNAQLASAFRSLTSGERCEILAWLDANPLPDADQHRAARVSLGDRDAVRNVLESLPDADEARSRRLASSLSYPFDWQAMPVEEWADELVGLLDHPVPMVAGIAARSLGRLPPGRLHDAVLVRLHDDSHPHRALLASAMHLPSRAGVEALSRAWSRRRPDEPGGEFLLALSALATDPGEIGSLARDALLAALGDAPAETGALALRLMALDADPRVASVLDRYLLSAAEATRDAGAPPAFMLRRWARRTGAKSAELLRSWSSHPVLGVAALEALTESKAGIAEADLVDAWRLRATSSDARSHKRLALRALASLGDVGRSAALEHLDLRRGHAGADYVGLWWLLQGITVHDAVEKSRQQGLPADRPAADDGSLAESPFDPYAHWRSILRRSGGVAGFDTETSTFPNRHDLLILDVLAAASRGSFRPTEAVEVCREANDTYDVAFACDGRWFHFTARGMGDWYDVESTVQAVNAALAESGLEERFTGLDTGGQDAFLVWARPSQLKLLAEELWLPLQGDHDFGKRLGRALLEAKARSAPP
jgi:hypothetical protein